MEKTPHQRATIRTRRRRLLGVAAGLFAAGAVLGVWGGCQMVKMPGQSHQGPLPAMTAEQSAVSAALRGHVEHLAGTIGVREVRHTPEKLEAAAVYIEQQLAAAGYTTQAQVYTVQGRPVRNIEATLAGTDKAGEMLVLGAHYDSAHDTPAANDNGSGVAALLELARLLKDKPLPRTVRFVAFVNEEPPYFHTEQMGSLVYARACRERGDQIVGMISLETMGYYTDAPKSQHYPAPFGWVYPSTGNFVAFVGDWRSRQWVHDVVGTFRRHAAFPSEGTAAPSSIQGVGWSDHWSFWQAGYPALMVTDTAPFRYPHYHQVTDTPDKIDYDRMARVVIGLRDVVREIGSR